MDSNNSNLHCPFPVMDNNIFSVHDPSLGPVDDTYHITGEALPNDFAQPPESTNHDLDITSSYPIANFNTYPGPPPFVVEDLSGYNWSQHFSLTTGHFQDLQDEGVMQSFKGVNGNTIPVLNTAAHHDIPSQPSPPAPLHTVNSMSLGPNTIQDLEPSPINLDSMPSSAQNSASGTPPPSDNEGRSPNTRATARYRCDDCDTSSQTKRDHKRHLTTKKHQKKTGNGSGSGSGAAVLGFHCLAQGCEYSREGGKTFTREDNLWRHIKTAHPIRSTA
ncbi:hypothetical protein B0T13DRAFT_533107 [Neurospora crassa]|nr:hypothetical protein B0T13DRAFT_533107 [Neurospora crassa]